MSLEPGQVIDGKYRIKRLIGEGGMGAVFEGENIRIQRRVAIKVLHPSFTGNKDVTARFERESQAAGRIGNDHILEVLDMGTVPDGSHFMVLEFLDGEPLSTRVKRLGRMAPEQLAPIASQVLAGLGAAHAAGIVHRDLKPDNIFVLKEKAGIPDYVKIIDFGISKFSAIAGDAMRMTSTGAVMGTPYYMSPEQASGSKEADGRSDLYSVGVILYECVTGRVPFDGETFNQLMFKIVLSDPPPLLDVVPDLNPAFASIILKAMARDVTQRFQSAAEFAQAIAAWSERGAQVSIPAPAPNEAAQRGALASVSGLSLPKVEDAPRAASASGGPGTVGTFATSQPAVSPPKNTVVIAAIAAGMALAATIVAGLIFMRGGSASAAARAETASSAVPANGSTLPAASGLPSNAAPTTVTVVSPAMAAPAATPPPASSQPPAPTVAPALPRPAAPATATPPSSVTAAKGSNKPAPAKPAARRSKDDFGY